MSIVCTNQSSEMYTPDWIIFSLHLMTHNLSAMKIQLVTMLKSIIKLTRFAYNCLTTCFLCRYSMLGPTWGHSGGFTMTNLEKDYVKWSHKSILIYYLLSPSHCGTEGFVMYCILVSLRIPLSPNVDVSARVVWDGSSAVKLSFISHITGLYAFTITGMM